MRRIVSLVTVAALMAAMLAMGAGPASALIAIPLTKEECKEAKDYFKEFGFPFKNQGECIAAVNQG